MLLLLVACNIIVSFLLMSLFIKVTLGVYQDQFAIMKHEGTFHSCVTIILMRLMVQLCLHWDGCRLSGCPIFGMRVLFVHCNSLKFPRFVFFQILFIKMIAKVTPNNSIIFFPSVFLMSVFPAAQTLGWLWGKSWAISLWCCLCKWTASSSSTLIRWKKPTGLCKQLSPCRETLFSYGGCLSVPPR